MVAVVRGLEPANCSVTGYRDNLFTIPPNGSPCRDRTYDIAVNSRVLCLTELKGNVLVAETGLEPATSDL